MDMEPTLLIISLIVIANINYSLQEMNTTTLSNDSLENFNKMIDKLIANTERRVTPTPKTDPTITTTTEKGTDPVHTTEKGSSKTNPEEEEVNGLTSSTEKETPDIINLNSTQPGGKSNNSRIIYINKVFPYNKTSKSLDGDDMLQLPLKQDNLDDKKALENSNTKPNLDGSNDDRAVPEYINVAPIDDSQRPSWFSSGEGVETDDNLPIYLNTRRNFGGNNLFSPITQNQDDHGAGVILKEEIVFEIEDDKPTIPSNPPIKIRIHTTTPKPVAPHGKEEFVFEIDDDKPTISSNPSIKIRFHTTTPKPVLFLLKSVKDNTTYFPYPSPKVRAQNIFGGKTNKSMYYGILKAHKNYSFDVSNHHNVSTLLRTRTPQTNMQAEFKKLHEKINTLQEFLNKTFDKENVTEKNLKVGQPPSKSVMRTGYPDYRSIERRRSRNRMRYGATPHIYHSKQRPHLLHQEQFMQEHPLLLQLADIAKVNQDIHLINRLRTRSKYIVPVPVYHRRIVFR